MKTNFLNRLREDFMNRARVSHCSTEKRHLVLSLVVAVLWPAISINAHADSTPYVAPDLKGKSLVFAGFGGDTQKNQDAAWLKPFAATTGVKINQTDSPDVARLELQQQAKNVGADVIQIEASAVNLSCGSTFAKINIDRSQIDPLMDLNNCGVPVVKFSYVLAYNSKLFPVAPTSVTDFFDTKKFPGRRAIWNYVNSGLIETALLADGVSRDGLYPVDMARALKKIDSIKSSTDFKGSLALVQDALSSNDVAMAIIPNGRAFNASKVNPEIKVVFKDAVTLYDNLAIPTGAKNLEAATAFMQYVAQNSTQLALAERFPYGVGTKGAPAQLGEQSRAFYPDTYSASLLMQDLKWWGANQASAQEQWLDTFSQ